MRIAAAIPALGLVLAGCGVPLDDFADEYARAWCAAALRCGEPWDTHVEGTPRAPYRAADCVADESAYVRSVVVPFVREGVAAHRLVYHPERVDACLGAVLEAPCAARHRAASDLGLAACGAVVEGRVADGQRCHADLDCLPGSRCNGALSCGLLRGPCPFGAPCSISVCAPQPPAPPCSVGCTSVGLLCDGAVCVPPLEPGAACGGSAVPCATDFVCDGRVCVAASAPVPGLGEPCGALGCAAGLVCAPSGATRVCVRPELGMPCDVLAGCGALLRCDGTPPVCHSFPPEGASCVTFCVPGARCTGRSICEAPRALGTPCRAGDECVSGACDGLCIAPPLCPL